MKERKIVCVVLIIMLIGLLMVYSASHIWAQYKFNDSLYFIKRQCLFAILGLLCLFITSKIDYHLYKKYSLILLIVSFLLLILVLIPSIGVVRGGSRSWFNLGLFAFQPSELFKFSIIVYVCSYIDKHYHSLKYLRYMLKPLLTTLFGFFLIMLQPDFGSGVVMVCSIMILIMISPFPFRYILLLVCAGILGIISMIICAPYRLKRILSFLDPFSDPLGSGFQMIQSLYAIAPGGLLGVGFNQSIQKRFYLPEPQTDFIFAIFLEEFGLIGGVIVVVLYGYFILSCLKYATRVPDLFGSFLLIGIISMIGIQTFINLCVCLGLMPVTGVPLLLFSYGGSSLVITLIEIGISINIIKSI